MIGHAVQVAFSVHKLEGEVIIWSKDKLLKTHLDDTVLNPVIITDDELGLAKFQIGSGS